MKKARVRKNRRPRDGRAAGGPSSRQPRLTRVIRRPSDVLVRSEAASELVRLVVTLQNFPKFLDEAPSRIADLFAADVCSIYLREEADQILTLRGNVGFSRAALGKIQLKVGTGITGQAVAMNQVIAVAQGPKHKDYLPFGELGEEHFPVFLAVPIPGHKQPSGAIVIQRKSRPFAPSELMQGVLVAGLLSATIRSASLQGGVVRPRKAGGGTRKATLAGKPMVLGRAIGAIYAQRRPAQRPARDLSTPDAEQANLVRAFDSAHREISELKMRAHGLNIVRESVFLDAYLMLLDDMRFRERAIEFVREGVGIATALDRVAREATRTASLTHEPFLQARSRDLEDLCDMLIMLAATDKRAELPQNAIVVADELTVFDLIISAKSAPVGIALSDRAKSPRLQTLLRLFDLPSVVGIEGLFRWAQDGDIALLDADHGMLVLNPSKSEVSMLRQWKRDHVS